MAFPVVYGEPYARFSVLVWRILGLEMHLPSTNANARFGRMDFFEVLVRHHYNAARLVCATGVWLAARRMVFALRRLLDQL
jgi:hypothetical protein